MLRGETLSVKSRGDSLKRTIQWLLVAVIWSGVIFLLGYGAALSFPRPAIILKGPPGTALRFGPEYFASMAAKYEAHLNGLPAEMPADGGPASPAGRAASGPEAVVVSKNGSKYYPKGCKAADRINVQSRVYFASASVAEAAGYTKAATCK